MAPATVACGDISPTGGCSSRCCKTPGPPRPSGGPEAIPTSSLHPFLQNPPCLPTSPHTYTHLHTRAFSLSMACNPECPTGKFPECTPTSWASSPVTQTQRARERSRGRPQVPLEKDPGEKQQPGQNKTLGLAPAHLSEVPAPHGCPSNICLPWPPPCWK